MANNRATKYIYHSEKTKTTCDECKKHDKEVYYDIKDIQTLPIHPNCKCWIEVVELKNIDSNTKCNCADTFKVLENNLNNSIENLNFMLNNIKDNLFNIEEELKQIKEEKKMKQEGFNPEISCSF